MRLDDGSPAIVKDLKPLPDVADELRGAHYLSWREGKAAVRLLGLHGRQMLLEHAGDRLLLHELADNGDKAAAEIAASVLRLLHSPANSPVPARLQPLRERFDALFSRARQDRIQGKSSRYLEAADMAERLLANPRGMKPLHGDLHHENIMLGPRGWLAIDPKGVIGDPAFDTANMFYNPLGHDELCRDRRRIAHMAELFAATIEQDEAGILDHAFAYGCLSAAWHAEDGNPGQEARALSIADAIREVRTLAG